MFYFCDTQLLFYYGESINNNIDQLITFNLDPNVYDIDQI